MPEDDITILPRVKGLNGQYGRLYYYQGNFFHPLYLHGSEVGRVKRAIREFIKGNSDRVNDDRAHPDYLTLPQLFDQQNQEFGR